MSPYRLDCDERDHVVVAALGGEVDVSNVREIEDAIRAAVGPATVGLVVDVGSLTYLDSSGVRLLLKLHDRLRDIRRGFAVARPEDGIVARVIDVVGLADEVQVVADVDGAVDALRTDR